MRASWALALSVLLAVAAGTVRAEDWSAVAARARGQTVYFNAWGGSTTTNDYIQWVAAQMRDRHGVELRHVKVADTATVVTRILAEKAAGRVADGSVDLVWINGENFAAMKANGLLYGPFVDALPNARLIDTVNKPTTADFTVPTDGMEAPWGMARFVMVHDSAVTPNPPRSPAALLAWAKDHPGRLTYPQPPHFLGTTFLKQLLIGLTPDRAALMQPAGDGFAEVTAPLWAYLDALHPALWRQGRVFPGSGPDLRRLLNDGEVDLSMAFSSLDAASAIESGLLPATARVYALDGGTIGNASFLAIPFNARARDAALVVADFLLSPEAQARKQDARYWGNDTVLDLAKLTAEQRALFAMVPRHPATPDPEALGPALSEPHPSWMDRIEAEWQRRYARG